MPLILKTQKFIVTGHDNPHHDRNNGGHAVVSTIKKYNNRTEMPVDDYLELMQLVMITGDAITTVIKRKGIEVLRINYQDNGNWDYFPASTKKPHFHIHLYVRSNKEKHPQNDPRFRAFPNALVFPYVLDFPEYYESFEPYTETDCNDIRQEIERLLDTPKHKSLRKKL